MGRWRIFLLGVLLFLAVFSGCLEKGDQPTPTEAGDDGPDGVGQAAPPHVVAQFPEKDPRDTRWSESAAPTRQVFFRKVPPREAYQIIKENQDNPEFVLVDLRTRDEVGAGHIAGYGLVLDFHAPDFMERLDAVDRDKTYMVYCQVGDRSASTLDLMADLGFERVYEMEGGITRWREEGLPLEDQIT